MPIDPPKRQEDYPDRPVDCEAALEPAFQNLMSLAFAPGWAPGEALRALQRLIRARWLADEENAKLEAELAILRAMERARS
jgi:hypothetical protein